MSGFRCQGVVVCMAVLLGASPLAVAQDAAATTATIPVQEVATAEPAPEAEKMKDGKSVALDAVVVTARKRAEALQKVPVSITAFSAKQMEQRGFTGLDDIARNTPGFTFEGFSSGGAHGNPVIRGLANQFTTTRIQNVSFFLDGVYLQRQSMLNLGLIDMERVEVVKGPQNALYGRNAFSGAVNYVTQSLPRKTQGYSLLGGGDHDRRDYRFSIAGPLTESGVLRGKFTAGKSSYDGDTANQHPITDPDFRGPHISGRLGGHDDEIYSVSLAYQPVKDLKLKTSYYYNELEKESKAAYSISGVNAARFGLRFDDQNDLNCNVATVPDIQPQPPRTHTGFSAWCGPLPRYASDVAPRRIDGIVIDPRAIGSLAQTQVLTLGSDYDFTDDFGVRYLYGNARHRSFTDGGPSDEDPIAGRSINTNALITQVNNQDRSGYTFANTASSRPNSILSAFSHELRFDWQTTDWLRTSFGGYYSTTRDEEWTNLFINDLCNDDTPQNRANCNTPITFPNTLDEQTVVTAAASYDLYTRQSDPRVRGEWTRFRDRITAGFASFNFNMTDELTTTLEARYSVESKFVRRLTDASALGPGEGICYGPNCPSSVPPPACTPTTNVNDAPVLPIANTLCSTIAVPTDSVKYGEFTPRAIVNWNFTDDNMLYVSAAKGVKAGGFNNAVTEDELVYDPETNWTYELGSKNQFFYGAFTLNGSIYYIDWTDLQSGVPPSSGSFSTSDIITNLAGAKNLGFEIETAARLSRAFSIDAGGSISNPKYKKGVIYSAGIQSTGAIHCDGVTCPADGDVGGNQLSRTSRYQGTVGANFDLPLGEWKSTTRIDGQYQSKQYLEPLNLGWVPGRQLLNASVKIVSPGKAWELGIWGKNLTNEDYASNSFVIGVFNQYIVGKGDRRTWGANLKYRF